MQKDREYDEILNESDIDVSALRSTKFEIASDDSEYQKSLTQFQRLKEKSATERDANFTDLVKQFVANYSDKYKQNKSLKFSFYIWVMVLFSVTMLLPFLVVILATLNRIKDWEIVISLITAFGTIITSFIVIPKIIAQYLFSLKEDETIVKIISDLHSGDIKSDPRKPSK